MGGEIICLIKVRFMRKLQETGKVILEGSSVILFGFDWVLASLGQREEATPQQFVNFSPKYQLQTSGIRMSLKLRAGYDY